MKLSDFRSLFVFLFFLSTLLFSSCSNFQRPQDEKNPSLQESKLPKLNQILVSYVDGKTLSVRILQELPLTHSPSSSPSSAANPSNSKSTSARPPSFSAKEDCPSFLQDEKTIKTVLQVNTEEQSKLFPNLRVCKALIEASTKVVSYNNHQIKIPQKIQRIAIIGDTGCRLKEGPNGTIFQECDDTELWPFAQIAEKVTQEKADLVLHVGDFHYRETCVTNKNCEKYKNTLGYGWPAWKADFFEPAAPLLSDKPWIHIRGNHEDCKRAHAGYFAFLSPDEIEASKGCATYINTRFIEIGDLLFISFDNSFLNDQVLATEDPKLKILAEKIDEINAYVKTSKAKNIFFLMHKPIWGLAPEQGQLLEGNLNMQEVLKKHPLNPKIQMIISGHIHNFHTSKNKNRPLQLVVGNSGDSLDKITNPNANSMMNYKDGSLAFIPTQDDKTFGYMIFEQTTKSKKANLWSGEFKNTKGQTTHKCQFDISGLTKRNFECKPSL